MRKKRSETVVPIPLIPPADKELQFASGSRSEMLEMPELVRRRFGFQLRQVQKRETPEGATPAEGSSASEVMKLRVSNDGDTYRCVYAAKFEKAVYVLHVFMKKSKSGIATPQSDIELVKTRLQAAKAHYAAHYEQAEQKQEGKQ